MIKLLGATGLVAAGLLAGMTSFATAQETIIVSMKGPGAGNPFWAAVQRGAEEKGAELGVKVVVMAPPNESDVAAQIAQIEDQLAKGVKGIVIAATDPNALGPVIDEALGDGIPVVFIDTKGINDSVTYIGTDNKTGAALAANHICANVPAGSEVAILQGIITQSTGKARADGAHDGLTACGLKVVAEQPANWDTAQALAVMENIITGHPNLKAVFASNDNMALGVVEALKSADMMDQVFVVGFDANPNAADSVLAGDMAATVAQNPYNMGAIGVESIMKLAAGETLAPVIDTGTVLVDKSNAADFQ